MDASKKEELVGRLRETVTQFYRKDGRHWKEPVIAMLRRLKEAQVDAVFFGGTLRSLLATRIVGKGHKRPRDVDIVISGNSMDSIREIVEKQIERTTRFGGLQVKEQNWQFDLWPVEKTWAFEKDGVSERSFEALPRTTFFNLEAIAVEVWPRPGKSRKVFAGNNQFFEGIIERLLEINREDNPFPSLCVVRAFVLAHSLDFDFGPRLTEYIVKNGLHLTSSDLKDVQCSHYGKERMLSCEIVDSIRFLADRFDVNTTNRTRLPKLRQRLFWEEGEMEGSHVKESPNVNLHVLASPSTPQALSAT